MDPTIEPIDLEVEEEEYDLDVDSDIELTLVRPIITVTDIPGGHRVTIEDIGSTQSFDVMDGEDGVSPTIEISSITGGHRLTITDATGTQTVDVMDGEKGDKGDTGATGATGNGIASITLNNDYTLTITYTNGQSVTTSSIRGAQGPQGETGQTGATGNGIASVTQNSDYTLTITMTDGTSYTTDVIRGAQGPQGETGQTGATGATPDFSIGTVSTLPAGSDATASVTGTAEEPVLNLGIPQGAKGDAGETGQTGATGNGIASVTLNNDYTLTITYTNGQSTTTTSVRGPQGPQGETGQTGATGNGIASVTLNSDYTLTITYTNGQSTTTSSIRGAQGPQGETGQTGAAGQDGVSPVVTITAITGGHRISITDKNGTSTCDVMDGTNGTDGDDGVSPTVTITEITGGHRVTITDADHPSGQSFDVMDGGSGGIPAGGDDDQVLSASSGSPAWKTPTIELDTTNAVGTAVVGTAETDEPTFTPSGAVAVGLDYSYTNYKLVINGFTASFSGAGIKLKHGFEEGSQ